MCNNNYRPSSKEIIRLVVSIRLFVTKFVAQGHMNVGSKFKEKYLARSG